MKQFGCLYRITNSINEKIYIGVTFQNPPSKRWTQHKQKAKNRVNSPLYNAINKYGVDNFYFEILLENVEENHLFFLEEKLIKELKLQDIEFGYNLSDGGNVNKGFKKSEKSKKEHSVRMSGLKNPFYNKKHTQESKDKISKKAKDRTFSEESKKKMSLSHRGDKSYLYGKKGELAISYGRKRPKNEIDSIKKNMPHRKEIAMVGKNEEILMIFSSLKSAGKWLIENGMANAKIGNEKSVASFIGRSIKLGNLAYGYKWIYIEKS